jgi:cell division protease FtsH
MDGFDTNTNVIVVAATNRPDVLDPALLRPGRFDRQVILDRPDMKGRLEILKVHIKGKPLDKAIDLQTVARQSPGFSGADLANLVNEATLVATRRNADAVTMDDFTAAIERIVAGLEKRNRLLNPLERQTVAYHEMGHALVALSLPGTDTIHKVSIIPRGIGALGYTIQRPTEDRFLMTREELEVKMAVLLGGRAAEMLVFGRLTTGAADDLARVTDIARSMVMRYGMDTQLGHVAYESEQPRFLEPAQPTLQLRQFSEEVAQQIDRAVRLIIERAFTTASEVLSRHREILDAGAQQLLQKETLTAEDLKTLLQSRRQSAPVAV